MSGNGTGAGLRIERRFTVEGQDPFATIEWGRRDSRITNPDGSVVFEMTGAEIPAPWSQVAADIMVSKYFRKAGVPQVDADGEPILDEDGNPVLGPERSAKQVISRLAETWRWWGEQYGYFASADDAQAFEDELKYMLVHQMAAPNSPQWFNTGLHHAYGITGTPEGFWYVDPDSEEAVPSPDTYSRPAPHACFPEGTRITTRDGFKPIEKIEVGDEVLTHRGRYMPVLETMQRQVDEPLVRWKLRKLSASPILSTANHPILAVRREQIRTARNPQGSTAPMPAWVPASSLRPGDFVVVGRDSHLDRVPQAEDLGLGLSTNYDVGTNTITTLNSAHRPTMNRFAHFEDPSIMRLFGRWLGDGSIGHESRDGALSSVNFAFDADDQAGISDIADLMEVHFGVTALRERARGQRTAHLRYVRRPLAAWFHATFGEGFGGKSLPPWVYELPRAHRIELLVGLFQADGCVHRVGGFVGLNFDHSNQELAEGIWRLARSLGYAPSLFGGTVRPGGTKPHYRVQVSARDAIELAVRCGVDVPATPANPTELRTATYVAYRVVTVDTEDFYGTVYNFQVAEDESYVASGVVVHNCFIQAVDDDLVNPGGIMDLWVREARLFKVGSGTGSNFSHIRAEGEPLSGGGKSSGLMSFLRVGDRAAGAIKSGGTTRRAAKMVILDLDHPDIEEFVAWKAKEEDKVRALIAAGYPSDFNGEAYQTVSGQNSNNSVRVPNEFLKALADDGVWELTRRTDGQVVRQVRARDLWRQIADAAWRCADPGVQFDTTINQWHTSPAGGRIRATNPCFTGETRIATDKGLIQFKDLVTRVANGETFDVYTHDATNEDAPQETISLTTPTQVMVTGTNEVLRLEFSDGRVVRATPNHRFFTRNRGYVRADELTADDKIRLLDQPVDFGMASWALPVPTESAAYQRWSSRKYEVNLPAKWSEPFAHYLGWLVGDGCVTDKAVVTVYGSEEEQQSTMLLHRELLAEINGGRAPKPVEMSNGTFQLRIHRHAFRRFVQALGVSKKRAHQKQVPWSIFEAPKPIVAAFLRGLYDADGCVVWTGDKNRYVGLGSASADLVRDVQLLLDTYAINSTIYSTPRGDGPGFTYTTIDGEDKSYKSKPMYDLRITSTSLEAFAAHIGFELSSKDDVLSQLLTETTRYRARYWAKLRSCKSDGWETTYNLTEPKNHSYLAQGALVSNCSEYVFLDNTACNLASLNLVAFADGAEFDIDAYRHAIRIWTVVLEISVTMAHFPSKEIAQGSYDYRTLGLGYANLGSLLMRWGIPYDSDEGRAIAGALTAVLTGDAYGTSAEMAEALGPFPKFAENREHMLRVMRNHRHAAYNAPDDAYEDIDHHVTGIDPALCPDELVGAARHSWDRALTLGEEHGYRNAQATVLAPTGTIGLLMDCDTTGVEPDFALVKFKKLAGGGYFKIANQSIEPALELLGYDEAQRRQIVDYVVGTMSLAGTPHINKESLAAKGLHADEIARIEATLPGVFDLRHAFNVFVVGEEAMERLGFTEEQYSSIDFDMLRAMGFDAEQVDAANRVICGMQTIEGAPHLRGEDLAVFDTANRNGRNGRRFIHYTGHITMMAAAQPFISGAISKTVNMPNEVSVEDVEDAYEMSWNLGLKAVALYRDGSKASQPLSASADEGNDPEDEPVELAEALEAEAQAATGQMVPFVPLPGMSPTEAYAGMPRPRFLLPARRGGWTQEARIGGHKVFLRTGEYEDGTLGEVFIDLAKEGATLRGVLSCFAIAVSKGLQYGVPLDEFVDTFTFQTFEPRGMVEGHPNIKMANSIVDYVFRVLGMEYLGRNDLVQVPPQVRALPEPPKGVALDVGQQQTLTEAAMEDDIEAQRAAAEFADGDDDGPLARPTGKSATVNLLPKQPAPVRSGPGAAAAASVPTMASEGPAVQPAPAPSSTAVMTEALGDLMGDAPFCDTCGHITVRNGSCYRCLNCGDSKGCS